MNHLSLFGLFAVTAMLVCYVLENRSHWFVLAFAGSCTLASAYGFLQGAWPFGMVEAVWSLVALRRWLRASFVILKKFRIGRDRARRYPTRRACSGIF
jgi:hypothetical protein